MLCWADLYHCTGAVKCSSMSARISSTSLTGCPVTLEMIGTHDRVMCSAAIRGSMRSRAQFCIGEWSAPATSTIAAYVSLLSPIPALPSSTARAPLLHGPP